ncbi:MAG: excinuclease ABC subunit UvrA [Gemmatimonadetes bacterium]|nr:excinuclease ABC subunit UvrA [Gemmatimonadota bacterium]
MAKKKAATPKRARTPKKTPAAKKPSAVPKRAATKSRSAASGPAQQARPPRRETVAIHGARVHNLKNVSLEIPRDQLVVVTGLSGSGKSSLAFDTLYAEGQRRYMESLSSFAKRFIAQVEKPDVDFVHGLSPVISIEQKTIGSNPRSTVGTLTDIAGYLNLLYATIGDAVCPRTGEPTPVATTGRILEALMALPKGATIELRAPVFPYYDEELGVLFTDIRKQGCRRLFIDGQLTDLADDVEEDATDAGLVGDMDVIVDRFVIGPDVDKQLKAGIQHALIVGDGLLSVHLIDGVNKTATRRFYKDFGSRTHHFIYGDISPEFFMFNNPESACRTCGGIGMDKKTHPDLLVPDPKRSLRGGCFIREAFSYKPDNWMGHLVYTLSQKLKFSLDTPWQDLPQKVRDAILFGLGDEPIQLLKPPDAKVDKDRWLQRRPLWRGVCNNIERNYRWYRQKDVANSGMERWLNSVMVDTPCQDCHSSRLRATRMHFTIAGHTIDDVGSLHFDELREFLDQIKPTGTGADAGRQVLHEINGRLDLLLGIGLDYLTFNRASGTLSGGEAQRIRLSTQIGSGLMGMLYVLDEPSIGLHPKDNAKMIATLKSLRDLGNTVVVVEHDESTIREADHVIEMGPGPGVHGGEVVAQGTLDDILTCPDSPTGLYLSGNMTIPKPESHRPRSDKALVVRGARGNNLKDLTVEFPLGQFIAVTGASGSGKSTLVNDILQKQLWKQLVDTRTLAGEHDALEGAEHVTRVIAIDQSPIGRNSRSNPATYVGFYDNIRSIFAATDEAKASGYKPGRFSFNVKGGRCEECQGEGTIRTKMYFMPDVEVLCAACKGKRYNADTLKITWQGRTISEILDMSIEEGAEFFAEERAIGPKVATLEDLGLGYLTLGQSATTLSGGEAQRIKLATELSKLQRRGHVVYILDEPTTGLHLADISRLLDCLHRLVDAGHTVIVIEHHLDVIKTADHVIDLGPEGGRGGGEILVTGTPAQVARCRASHTGRFLKDYV